MEQSLIIVCGLSGTGKSHAAKRLSQALGYEQSNPELVRHELGITRYSRKDTPKVLARMIEDIEHLVQGGKGVVLDANLKTNDTRQIFYDTAHALSIPAVVIECVAPENVAKRRIIERDDLAGIANHPKDARVFDIQKKLWQDISIDCTLPENDDITWLRYDTDAQKITVQKAGTVASREIESILTASL